MHMAHKCGFTAGVMLQRLKEVRFGEIILRRTVSADGRSRAFVNDSPVGIGLAREIGAAFLEVHGQTDDRGLFDIQPERGGIDVWHHW